jgi:RimJ/RimL family protein N-acetyltransferase
MTPTLATQRLVLRPIRLADFEPYAALLASDRARYMDGPHDRAKAWAWFTGDVAGWQLFGRGALSVEVAESGKLAGQVGFGTGGDFPEVELGWFLHEGFEGHGFATEACAALRGWGFGPGGLETFVSYIDPDNRPSRRLAERLGAAVDPGAATPNGDPTLVYRHRRPA